MDLIQGLHPHSTVTGQPIAQKGQSALKFPPPLVADATVTGLLNKDDVKALTRTVPRVVVSSTTLSEDGGLMKEAKNLHQDRFSDENYFDRAQNRDHIVREASERATFHAAVREKKRQLQTQ